MLATVEERAMAGPDLRVEQVKTVVGRRRSWVERAKVIHEQFPSTLFGRAEWKRIFDEDEELLVQLWQVVLVYDQTPAGKPGVKPDLDRAKAEPRLMQFLGRDYSLEPFAETVRTLKALRRVSIRGLHQRTGFSLGHLYRLLNDGLDPDSYDIEQVAAAFDKHPSYFLEWRNAYVAVVINQRLTEVPEASVSMYRRMLAAASA